MAGPCAGCHESGQQFFESLTADLLAYAEHQFDRSARAADGNAKGDHIDAAKRSPLYKAEVEPEAPALPVEFAYLWDMFLAMNRKRQNGMAVNPLSDSEILAWQARRRIRLDVFEEEVIDRLDGAYLASQMRKE